MPIYTFYVPSEAIDLNVGVFEGELVDQAPWYPQLWANRQLQQRRQTQRNGSFSKFQKNDAVYYEWLNDVSSSVVPDGKFYLSVVTYVMFRPSLQEYVYTIHSVNRVWKTTNIRESDNALYFLSELPSGATMGQE